ncbi:MAG: AAA family ATPase [Anaerolineales bacterium]|nr:AAA family ATPase [Anaerolineales bacterium]MCS7247103.1 AAA family ATPase [Anaerolineales bacterium]MDW8160914.1 AAA family ATPase [Anaerolineales bacterium]MDW8447066.1 AAA family ATPase [Anaerolineales bacterium]
MSTTIALAGKGGVGKTTIAALIIKWLVRNKMIPILAIDADPSSNLNLALGVELESTVGDIREDLLEQVKESLAAGGAAMGSLPGGIAKREYLDYQIRSAIVEGQEFDLIAMGRPEGPGCYCAVNHNLRMVIDTISKNYRYVVIDNEAGMEHLSRRTTRNVDHLIIVSDPSLRGLIAAQRIANLCRELDISIHNVYLVLNRVREEIASELRKFIHEELDIPLIGVFREEGRLSEFDASGKPIIELGEDTPIYLQVAQMMDQLNSRR